MLEDEYLRAASTANEAGKQYLEAVRVGESRQRLTDLALDARDLWAAVSTICALGEEEARLKVANPPLRHRQQATNSAWIDRRNWAVRAEDASARSQAAGALMSAHLGQTSPDREALRLVSVKGWSSQS